jgi:hypothetical protein
MFLTFKIGAALGATAAASFLAGATLAPTNHVRDVRTVMSSTERPGKTDRLDVAAQPQERRIACLGQDWLRLSPECAELFTVSAQVPQEVRSTTILVRDAPGRTTAIRVPRPESEYAFR